MNPQTEQHLLMTRRHFFGLCSLGAGTAALASLLNQTALAQQSGLPHFKPRAKRIIYLFQSGAPSQLELFDPKPQLEKYRGQNLPESVRMGQRLTGMTAFQSSWPTAPSLFKFAQQGQSGATLSELLPHTAKLADSLCFIKSMHTEQINHDPAITFALTGFQLAGRPSFGSWVSYGLGSENQNLPAYVVLPDPRGLPVDGIRNWSNGWMPPVFQGTAFRSDGVPVLNLKPKTPRPAEVERGRLDLLAEPNAEHKARRPG